MKPSILTAKNTKTINDGFETFTWQMNDVSSIGWEPGMPYLYENIPSITVSSIADWNEFAGWAYSTFKERIKVNDEIKLKADELTSSVNLISEKIKRIFDFVKDEIDYIQADLDRGGLIPHYADEVLRTKYGDCKDQVILMLSLLKAINIEGYPALLSTFSDRDHQDYLPTQYFNHLIVYIPTDSTDIWLDATTEFIEFPYLYYSNQNKWALVIKENDGVFIKTPSSTAEENTGIFSISIHPEKDSLVSTMVFKSCGVIKDNLFSLLDYYTQSENKTMMSDLLDYYYNESVVLHDFTINPTIDKYYTQNVRANYVDPINKLNGFTFTNNMAFAVLYFMIEMPFYETRNFDYIFPFMFSLKGREVYHSPWENISVWNVPENDSVISDYFEFHQFFNDYEDSVEVEWDFILKKELVIAEDFEQFNEELEEWNELVAYEIDFIKKMDPGELSQSIGDKVKIERNDDSKFELLDSNNIFIEPTIVHTENIDPEMVQSIIEVLNENVNSVNDKDFDRAMNTIYKDHPEYDKTTQALEKIISNEKFKATFGMENPKVLDVINNCAIVTNTTTVSMKYLSNEAALRFNAVNVFINTDDGWKIYNTYAMSEKTTCDLYEELGRYFYSKKEYENTVIFYDLASRNDSTCDRVYGNLGWTYYLLEDYNKCIEFSEKAVERDSTALYAHYNIALSYLCLGEIEKAKSLYTDIVKFNKELKRDILNGAIIDLKDLIDKDFMKEEAEQILSDIFEVRDTDNPLENKNPENRIRGAKIAQ